MSAAEHAHEHVEKHFTATAAVRDIVIGMSDGLTVPFALAAGLTSAATAIAKGTGIIVTAGFAEIAAGSIAMGLGGYLAAKTDSEHYASELEREYRETVELPEIEIEEVAKVFREYGLTEAQMAPVVSAITGNQKRWVDFMMRFELGLEEPDPARAGRSAATIAASYIVGGLVPLAPYIVMKQVLPALWVSVGVTLLALFVFGSIKGHYTGLKPFRGGVQTVLVGGLAAAAAFLIARLISQ
ncbi:MAG TPA: VIT1/CCC1 transporter family protein [Acidobacteriaceae bacterium]|jgi:VIT1/CCC1 family predicted Fe2+/Mn2+ transporter|nr:VIT1/CCC1 transporter family protein [Acidobacteriaceae bacterium]